METSDVEAAEHLQIRRCSVQHRIWCVCYILQNPKCTDKQVCLMSVWARMPCLTNAITLSVVAMKATSAAVVNG